MKDLPSKAELGELSEQLFVFNSYGPRNSALTKAAEIFRKLTKMKTIVIDPGHRHTPQCPFWTGASAERHCRICPPDIELGQCFGAIPVWCPLPVLVRLKTDDEDMTAQLGAKETEDISEHINGRSVTVRAEERESGELFGWVGPRKIAEAIRNEFGVDVQPNQVILNKSFREFGVFDVSLRLECNPKIKVWIVKDAPDEPDDPKPDEPEEPKVESLREAADRLGYRAGGRAEDQADLCAIVLRELRRLAEIIRSHVTKGSNIYPALREQLARIAQMLEGCE